MKNIFLKEKTLQYSLLFLSSIDIVLSIAKFKHLNLFKNEIKEIKWMEKEENHYRITYFTHNQYHVSDIL